MIKYKNGTIDTREVVSIYNWGLYDDLIALVYDKEADTFEELKLCGYWSSGYLDPIEKVINNLSQIESIDYKGTNFKLLEKFLQADFKEILENTKEEYNNLNGNYEFHKGDMVEVFRGRKYSIGMTFKILAFNEYTINYYNRVMYALTKDADGKWQKVDCKNIRLVDRENLIMRDYTLKKEEVLNKMSSLVVDDNYKELTTKLNK